MNSRGGGGGGGGAQTPPSTPTVLFHHNHNQNHNNLPSTPSTSPASSRPRAQSGERDGTTTTTTITPVNLDATTRPVSSSLLSITPAASVTISLTPPSTTTTTTTSTTTNTTGSRNQPTTTTTTTPRSPPTNVRGSATTTHLSPYCGHPTHGGHKKQNTADSRLVVLGSPAVGKSALVVRLLTGRFIWEYDPTLESAYRHHTMVDDEVALMDILDTAGQGESVVVEGHARWGEGFLLVFSLTDRASFTSLPALHASLAAFRATPHFPCVIVANKTDLGHLAQVKEEEAGELAGDLGASFFLTSASEGGPTITDAFTELHREVVRRRWSRRRRSSAKTVIEGFYKMFSR